MTAAGATGAADRIASHPDPTAGRGAARVVVTGAAGSLGRRVTERLRTDPATEVVELDRRATGPRPGTDLLIDDLGPHLAGARTVVHLASSFGTTGDREPDPAGVGDVAMVRRLLDAATASGVDHLVVLSSATVYGAWANNPVPLTEDAPLRPEPRFAHAVQRAEIERLVADWVAADPGTRAAAVLRPVPAGSADHWGWLINALRAAGAVKGLDEDPPAQFLSLDDLASAVETVTRGSTAGVFNVAPDGWLTPTRFRELAGARARLRVPQRLAVGWEATARRLSLVETVPGARAYASGTWVVANDRLRALGWAPTDTNEEAYVAAVPGGSGEMLSAGRRRALSIGAGVTALAVVAGAAVTLRHPRGRRGVPTARRARSARRRRAGRRG